MYWAAELVEQIARGVQHAHDGGIYHRDLKPANILLTSAEIAPMRARQGCPPSPVFPRFCPKVGDFGLAKILGEADLSSQGASAGAESSLAPERVRTDSSSKGARIGTKFYMAPEQILADSASIGRASDVWALGVIIYELLTRHRPFEGSDDEELLKQICGQDPVPLRTYRQDLPPALETLCRKCLEKDPRGRYASAGELADELEKRVLRNFTRDGLPLATWDRARRWVKEHPIRTAFLGLGATALLASAEYAHFRRNGEDDLLLRQLETATISKLPGVVPRVSPRAHQGNVRDRLKNLFGHGTDTQKLGAALCLLTAKQLPEDKDTYVDFCYGRLLGSKLEELEPIARLLNDGMPNLARRLEVEAKVDAHATTDQGDQEHHDRRRATAACTLSLLGSNDRTWSLLQARPDPQARSFLIHSLGPAGVEPARLVERLQDPGTDESVRIALIQSLDLIAASAWDANLRARVTQWLFDRYQHDPSAGVHGSLKWLLRRWGIGAELDRIDGELAKAPPDPRLEWRISREGLTLITVDNPAALGRVIEVADTEITVEMFERFNQTRPKKQRSYSSPQISPSDACPVNGVSYFDAAAFCNWLSGRERLPDEALCYRSAGLYAEPGAFPWNVPQVIYEPAAGHHDLAGFRLPTIQEFDVFCAAGTITRRYHGNSNELLDRYAWIATNSGGSTHPVASLMPNDFGLFDSLGNVMEWCESRDLRGGWYLSPRAALDRSFALASVAGFWRDPYQGFRVVRTKKVHKRPVHDYGSNGGSAQRDPPRW
jgi:hypothetical protein